MSSSAKLVEAFIGIALIPDSGANYFYTKIMGYSKAFEFATLNKPITSDEALRIGMVNHVYHPQAFKEGLYACAKTYAEGPTQTYGYVKLLLQKGLDASLDDILDMESEYQQLAGESYDYAEGVKAFIEKRSPRFLGK
jgi:2-(1,2-epoxy-1,2-dihydrophenyl)acetyl-CoA isomerase